MWKKYPNNWTSVEEAIFLSRREFISTMERSPLIRSRTGCASTDFKPGPGEGEREREGEGPGPRFCLKSPENGKLETRNH